MPEIAFILITVVSILLFYLAFSRNKTVIYFYVAWFTIVGLLSYNGFFLDTKSLPPRFLLVIVPSVISVFYFYRILKGKPINMKYALALQGLRLPVELVLYALYLRKQIPLIMTFHGWNFDISVGITALLLLGYVVIYGRQINALLFKWWNISGLVLLGIIVFTALLSTPSPLQQFAFARPNMAILNFPFASLPAIVVPLVLLSHLLLLREIKGYR